MKQEDKDRHTKALLLDDLEFYYLSWLMWSFYTLLFYMCKVIVYWQETSDEYMCVQWSRITLEFYCTLLSFHRYPVVVMWLHFTCQHE